MSGIMKVFLLLAVMFCFSEAQLDYQSGNQCLCAKVQRGFQYGTKMKDIQIQIYPQSAFCDKVEIVVSNIKTDRRYCLHPEFNAGKSVLASLTKLGTSTTTRPTRLSSTSSTAHI
ncbi:uncharacterized protein AB9W97_006966 [Spinachia spinachia]